MVQLNGFKLARMRAKMRQIDLAMAVGVSESLVAKWETGRIKPNQIMLKRLSEVLNVSSKDLFTNEENNLTQKARRVQ